MSHTGHDSKWRVSRKGWVNLWVSTLYAAFTEVCSTIALIYFQKYVNKVLNMSFVCFLLWPLLSKQKTFAYFIHIVIMSRCCKNKNYLDIFGCNNASKDLKTMLFTPKNLKKHVDSKIKNYQKQGDHEERLCDNGNEMWRGEKWVSLWIFTWKMIACFFNMWMWSC